MACSCRVCTSLPSPAAAAPPAQQESQRPVDLHGVSGQLARCVGPGVLAGQGTQDCAGSPSCRSPPALAASWAAAGATDARPCPAAETGSLQQPGLPAQSPVPAAQPAGSQADAQALPACADGDSGSLASADLCLAAGGAPAPCSPRMVILGTHTSWQLGGWQLWSPQAAVACARHACPARIRSCLTCPLSKERDGACLHRVRVWGPRTAAARACCAQRSCCRRRWRWQQPAWGAPVRRSPAACGPCLQWCSGDRTAGAAS